MTQNNRRESIDSRNLSENGYNRMNENMVDSEYNIFNNQGVRIPGSRDIFSNFNPNPEEANVDYMNYLRLTKGSQPTSPFNGFNSGYNNMGNRNNFINSPLLGRSIRIDPTSPNLQSNAINRSNAEDTSFQNNEGDLAHQENLSIAASDYFVPDNGRLMKEVNTSQSNNQHFISNAQEYVIENGNMVPVGYLENIKIGYVIPANEADKKKYAENLSMIPLKESRKFNVRNNKSPSESPYATAEKQKNFIQNDSSVITPNSRDSRHYQNASGGQTHDYQDSPNGTNRHKRGLKVLSVRVRDIVYDKKKTSYKEVADTLIMEDQTENDNPDVGLPYGHEGNVSLKIKKPTKKKAKLDANVRRRVYDALNVLIAARVLKKHAKEVFFNNNSFERNYKHEKSSRDNQLQAKEYCLHRKKIQLTNLIKKFIAVKSLINRNSNSAIPPEVRFPFQLVMPTGGTDTVVTFEMQPDYKKLLLGSNKEIQFNGDLEVLVMLSIHLNLSMKKHKTLLQQIKNDPDYKSGILENNHLGSMQELSNSDSK